MRTIKLALVGLGTVATGVARLLEAERELLRQQCGATLDIKWVVVRDPDKRRDVIPSGAEVITDINPVLEDPEVEIAVELMGTVRPAFEIISNLLRAGKHVVTANKAVLAELGRELFEVARENQRAVGFEASVCGGIPIIAAVSQSLASNRIHSLAGIVNGTSNYILSAMSDEGMPYDDALKQAQALGFAEADPTMDVDGADAAQKLAILSRLAFQASADWRKIRRQGIDRLTVMDIGNARDIGYVIKLLALAQREGDELRLRVGPTLVHENHPLGQVRGEYNAISVVGSAVGDTLFVGKGAGMMPTAASVVANILDLAIGRGQETFRSLRLWESSSLAPQFRAESFFKSRFYLRYTISDQPGALAQIAGALGNHGISIASVIQHETSEDAPGAGVPLVVMTHSADEGDLLDALAMTDSLPIVKEPTVCFPVAD